jgi:acetolactate synthase small subunit
MSRKEQLKNSIAKKSFVKIIAGIDNFDIDKVKQIVTAAEKGGANAVDIAANAEIIKMAKETTNLPVFVSSIKPEELAMAAMLGVDAIEVGNFDALYKAGTEVSAEEVLEITRKTIELAGNDVFLSVTIPGHIEINDQIRLAQQLEEMGVDLIQTEGAATVEISSDGARGLIQQAHVSISNTIELVRNIEVPVMTASGITSTTASIAFAAGASAIGIGSFVNKLSSTLEMTAAVMSIMSAVNARVSLNEEVFA